MCILLLASRRVILFSSFVGVVVVVVPFCDPIGWTSRGHETFLEVKPCSARTKLHYVIMTRSPTRVDFSGSSIKAEKFASHR